MVASLTHLSPGVILPVLLILSLLFGRLLAGPLVFTPIPNLFERVLLYSLCGSVAFSWMGTVLAVLGIFRWWFLILLSLGLIVWVLGQKYDGILHSSIVADLRHTPWPALILLLLLLVGCGWLFARPAESFFVFNDAAVYTIGAVVLARTGSLFVNPDSFWYPTGAFLRQFFFTDHFGLLSRHYGPFYQWTPWNSTLEIGFLPLPKVWMSILVWLFGPEHTTWVTPFLGLVSLAVFYCLVNQLMGWKVGLSATLLLGVSLPQIWFARYPISEIYTQCFFLSGLYLLVLAGKNISNPIVARRLALWSGLAFATLTILRLEAVLLLLVFASLMLLGWYRKYAGWPSFARTWLVSLTVAGIVGLVLSVASARYYLFTRALELTPHFARLALFVALVAVACGMMWTRIKLMLIEYVKSDLFPAVVRHLPLVVALGWLLWGGIAGYHLIRQGEGQNLVDWVSWYWTVPALILSTLGAVWVLLQGYKKSVAPELLVLLGSSVALLVGFSIRSYVYPIHPWAMRRLVPVVMPALAVTTASILTVVDFRPASARLRGAILRKWGLAGLSVFCVASLAIAIGWRSLPILFHRERAGLWRQLESMTNELPSNAVLLFDNGNISQGLTQAMELIFDRVSLVIQQNPSSDRDSEVDILIETALDQERPVYLVVTNGDLAWWPERWRFVDARGYKIEVPVLRQPKERLPSAQDLVTQTLLLDMYQIKPVTGSLGAGDLPVPVNISAGFGSYPYLRKGFHKWYSNPEGVVTRWTDGEAVVMVPWLTVDSRSSVDFCIALDVAGGRPLEETPVNLVVTVEGVEVFEDQLDRSFTPETLRIPVRAIRNEKNTQLEIQLDSTTWDASKVGDDRTLGVLFYGLQLLSLNECSID
jgi:hypothetical protein